jgi:hypothetical protein
MNQSTNSTTTFPFAGSTVASKTINAAEDYRTAVATDGQPGALDSRSSGSLAQSFVMRRLAPALARVEIYSKRAVCSAADKTFTAAGNTLVRLGEGCLDAGERAAARGNICTLGSSDGNLRGSLGHHRSGSDDPVLERAGRYKVELARVRLERAQARHAAAVAELREASR